jgi:hypothetical protein
MGARFSVPIQSSPEAHPASITMGTEAPSWGTVECGTEHPPPSSTEVKPLCQSWHVRGRPLPVHSILTCYGLDSSGFEHPASCAMGIGSLSQEQSGQGLALTTPPPFSIAVQNG